MYTTLNLEILSLSKRKEELLDRIIIRDQQVIRYYYHVLEILGTDVKPSEVDEQTLTTRSRRRVRYDVKKQYTGYTREFQELRDNAIELHRAKLAKGNGMKMMGARTTRRMNVQRPRDGKYTTGTCRVVIDHKLKLSHYWLRVYNPFGDDHLLLPLKIGQGAIEYLKSREVDIRFCRTVHLSKKENGWMAHLTFIDDSVREIEPDQRYPVPCPDQKGDMAILALDPGLRIPYTGVWLTPNFKLRQQWIRYYRLPDVQRRLHVIDKQVSKTSRRLSGVQQAVKHWRRDTRKLRVAAKRRRLLWRRVRKQGDIEVAKRIVSEVRAWASKGWDVRVVVGKPAGGKISKLPRFLRRKLSRWKSGERPELMQRVSASHGFDVVTAVKEEYTSKTCWRCGNIEFRKYRTQSLQRRHGRIFRHGGWFECYRCGWKGNADVNGAINIGKRYLLTQVFRPGKSALAREWRRDMWWKWEQIYQQRVTRAAKKGKVLPSRDVFLPKYSWKAISKLPGWRGQYLLWARYPTDHLPVEWSWIATDPAPPVRQSA